MKLSRTHLGETGFNDLGERLRERKIRAAEQVFPGQGACSLAVSEPINKPNAVEGICV